MIYIILYRCVKFINNCRNQLNGSIYIHCKAGRGRSTVVVAAYFISYYNLNVSQALKTIKQKRRFINLSKKQIETLKLYEKEIKDM